MEWWYGLIGIGAGIGCAALAYLAREHVRAMVTTETVPVAELRALHRAAVDAAGPGQFRYRCEVVGRAEPRKRGPLTSELRRVECVWHRHRVTHRYWELRRTSNGGSRRRTRNEVVAQRASTTPFRLRDATGSVAIRVGEHEVVGAEKVLDEFRPDSGGPRRRRGLGGLLGGRASGGTIGFKREEWALRPGGALYVLGEATDANGRLAIGEPSEGGVFIVSAKSQAELVRRERLKYRGFGAGAALATVAGAVVLALGLAG